MIGITLSSKRFAFLSAFCIASFVSSYFFFVHNLLLFLTNSYILYKYFTNNLLHAFMFENKYIKHSYCLLILKYQNKYYLYHNRHSFKTYMQYSNTDFGNINKFPKYFSNTFKSLFFAFFFEISVLFPVL